MEINEVLIKFEPDIDGKMKISWNLNPDTKIEDLFFAFDSAQSGLRKIVNQHTQKIGIKTEKQFLKYIQNKSFRDINI